MDTMDTDIKLKLNIYIQCSINGRRRNTGRGRVQAVGNDVNPSPLSFSFNLIYDTAIRLLVEGRRNATYR